MYYRVKSLPSDKFLDWLKLKAFADDKIDVSQKQKFFLGQVENIAGKGENADYQHFLLLSHCFQKPSCTGSLGLFGKELSASNEGDCLRKRKEQHFRLVQYESICIQANCLFV